MKLTIFLILCVIFTSKSASAFEDLSVDYTDELTIIPEYHSEARLLNITFDTFSNNSLLSLVGIFVVGVIFFGECCGDFK